VPAAFEATGNLAASRLADARLPAFMPLEGQATPEPVNAVERGLADLWRRTAGPMNAVARCQFRAAVLEMTSSWLWELANRAQHRIPDPVDYVEMRRKTFGSDMTMSLAWLADAQVVPEPIRQLAVLRELDTAAQDYACFTNDLFSYQKEIEFDGDVHNLVLVLEHFLEVDRFRAAVVVADLMAARMRQFEQIADGDLPVLLDDLDADDQVRAGLTGHADGLKNWMSGILQWHRATARYPEAELRRSHLPATQRGFSLLPAGLGTSAARLRR
jgi:germacradienol/geosmin synthase